MIAKTKTLHENDFIGGVGVSNIYFLITVDEGANLEGMQTVQCHDGWI